MQRQQRTTQMIRFAKYTSPTGHVVAWQQHLIDRGLTPVTVNNHLAALSERLFETVSRRFHCPLPGDAAAGVPVPEPTLTGLALDARPGRRSLLRLPDRDHAE